MRFGGIIGWLQSNVIAIVAYGIVSSVIIGAGAYCFGVEKMARFTLATAHLGGSGQAILSETPSEWSEGYNETKVIAMAQKYNPTTGKFETVKTKSAKEKAAEKKAAEKARKAEKKADEVESKAEICNSDKASKKAKQQAKCDT